VTGDVAAQDLTILGRKLSASLKKKPRKIPVLSKPLETLKMPSLTLRFCENRWQVFPDNDDGAMIVEKRDRVYCLAYLAWNDLYFPGQLRMLPTATSGGDQENIKLLRKKSVSFRRLRRPFHRFSEFPAPEHTEIAYHHHFAAPPRPTLSILFRPCLNNWRRN
jgi:adenylate cyclase class 1